LEILCDSLQNFVQSPTALNILLFVIGGVMTRRFIFSTYYFLSLIKVLFYSILFTDMIGLIDKITQVFMCVHKIGVDEAPFFHRDIQTAIIV